MPCRCGLLMIGLGNVSQRQLHSTTGNLVNNYETPAIRGAKLSIRIEQLDAVDGSIWSQINIHLIAQRNRLNLCVCYLSEP